MYIANMSAGLVTSWVEALGEVPIQEQEEEQEGEHHNKLQMQWASAVTAIPIS